MLGEGGLHAETIFCACLPAAETCLEAAKLQTGQKYKANRGHRVSAHHGLLGSGLVPCFLDALKTQ